MSGTIPNVPVGDKRPESFVEPLTPEAALAFMNERYAVMTHCGPGANLTRVVEHGHKGSLIIFTELRRRHADTSVFTGRRLEPLGRWWLSQSDRRQYSMEWAR